MGLKVISNSRILRFKILDGFVKSKFLTFCKLSKQGIWILITQIQIHVWETAKGELSKKKKKICVLWAPLFLDKCVETPLIFIQKNKKK